MTHRYNPYRVSSHVEGEDFYGRQALLDKIWRQQSRVIHLVGMRRIGKTSLLKKLATMGKSIFLDLQDVRDWADFAQVLQYEIIAARSQFPWLPITEVEKSADLFGLLRLLDHHLDQAGAHLWLLLDEAEVLIDLGYEDIKALRKFQSLLRRLQALQLVFASAKLLTELDDLTSQEPGYGSPFLNEFPPPIYISGLDHAAALALIRQVQNPPALPVADEIAQIICQHTNNHPYLIQRVCYSLWERNPNSTTWCIDNNTFKAPPDLQRILKKDFDYLSDLERQIVRAILIQQAVPDIHQIYLEGLTSLGYLRQVEVGYDIGNDFFKNWLLNLGSQDWTVSSKIGAESTLRFYEKTARL